MSNGLPAARKTDSVTHKSGNIITGSSRVRISGLPAARVGDVVQHGYGTEVITEGSSSVRISGQFAARVTDAVACGGRIASGSSRVRIGRAVGQAAPSGQAQGNPSNNALVGQKMCQDAARGRRSGKTRQSYNNCQVEAARQIINRVTGKNITEDGLMRMALDRNQVLRGEPTEVPVGTPPRSKDGTTNYTGVQAILENFNITSTVQTNNLNNISKALASRKGVIAVVDSKILWGYQPNDPRYTPNPDHAVLVTGLEYDDNGKITDVIINDTGTGECSQKVPVDTWNKAARTTLNKPALLNVTDKPIF